MKPERLTGLLLYIGTGALFHALFYSTHFDWTSTLTWGWLLGWPAVLIATGYAVVLLSVGISLVVLGAIALVLWLKGDI